MKICICYHCQCYGRLKQERRARINNMLRMMDLVGRNEQPYTNEVAKYIQREGDLLKNIEKSIKEHLKNPHPNPKILKGGKDKKYEKYENDVGIPTGLEYL